MGLDLSFLESDLIELLNDAGIYDASVRRMDKVILRKEKSGDEDTFCVDVCYSMEHNGKAVILTHQFGCLNEVFASFSLTAGGFELSADMDNEAYNAQYAAFTPVNLADQHGEDVAARIQDLIDPAPESDPNALPSHEYYSHLALIKDFHKNWNEETQAWEDLLVTADTIMVVLCVLGSSDAKELGNHIKVVDPNLPARFVIDDTFLPNIEFEKQQKLVQSLKIKSSLVSMDVAPCVRVELSWPTDDRLPCKAVWDIPFTGKGALKDFRLEHEPRGPSYVYTLTFKCNGGRPMEGQHNLKQRSKSKEVWKPEDHEVYRYVEDPMKAKDKDVKIELWQSPPPPKNKSKKDPESDEALAVPKARISALCGIAKALCLDKRGSHGIKFARDSAK